MDSETKLRSIEQQLTSALFRKERGPHLKTKSTRIIARSAKVQKTLNTVNYFRIQKTTSTKESISGKTKHKNTDTRGLVYAFLHDHSFNSSGDWSSDSRHNADVILQHHQT